MKKILSEIRSGKFAEEWIKENKDGLPNYNKLKKAGEETQIEKVGAQLRSMMPFISASSSRPQDVSGG